MRPDNRSFEYLPHAILARYYAYDLLVPHQSEEQQLVKARPSRLATGVKRLATWLGERRRGGAPAPQLQGCG